MVRFNAEYRIKSRVPQLVRFTVNSFKFQTCVRSSQAVHLSVSIEPSGAEKIPYTRFYTHRSQDKLHGKQPRFTTYPLAD